jgi:predicted nucleotidyltransferase
MLNNDNKLPIIHDVIGKHLPGAKVILFGSRAKGIYDDRSDYDVLAVADKNLTPEEIKIIRSKIRRDLAEMFIPIDIIVTCQNEVQQKAALTNHIINEALATGIAI